MECDPNFSGTFPYFSGLFLENPCIKPEIPTMVNPLQGSSTLEPPSPLSNINNSNNSSSLLLHHNHNFHHFPLNLNYHHGNFVMEGGPSSSSINPHHHPFFSSSSVGDRFEVATAYVTNSGSLMGDFVTPDYMAFTPPNSNNKMVISDALHGYDNGLQVVGPTLSPSSPLVYDDHSSVPMNHNNKLKLQDEISSIAHGSNPQQRAEVGAVMRRQQKRMLRKQSSSKVQRKMSNIIKGQWASDEDRLLLQLVECYGLKKWSKIAKFLNGRVGKQCRERWHNHLRPNIRKESWTEEEDRALIEAHQEIGNKWAEIAQKLPGRTENTIKNRWNATKRRLNSKRQKNKLTISKGTLLMNYIKQVYEAEAATKELKNCMSKMKIMSTNDCINNDHQQGLLRVQYESLDGGFDSQDWATTTKEDSWSQKCHVFPRRGGGYVPELDINADDVATRVGFDVDKSTNMNYEVAMEMENLAREAQMEKEMDLMEMICRNR